MRLRDLAASRVRYGYRRLTVLLKRERWKVNAKRIYRLYTEEGLIVRTKRRKQRAQRQRVARVECVLRCCRSRPWVRTERHSLGYGCARPSPAQIVTDHPRF